MRFYIYASGILIADQITKYSALTFLSPQNPVKLIPSFFWLTLRHNSGAAFSLFSEYPFLLTIFTFLASIVIIVWGVTLPRKDKMTQIALGIIAGGALGNLVDRLFRGGFVVDFIDIHWLGKVHWPTFNLADSAICTGVGLVLLEHFMSMKKGGKLQEK
ncbi:signal peptidase II [Candidatus Sumerlaeota bacterium]|nr:signal peptidase II [Candidatus Sumerlaeota bacterium]